MFVNTNGIWEGVDRRAYGFLGAFRFGLDTSSPGLRLITFLANLRSRVLGMPYGDQGVFVPSGVFQRIGGISQHLG